MTAPLISIALPVRNGANYLAAALDSILAQSYGDFELHVSDNASDDATPDILADYAARDPRVRVSRCAELLGQVANMNRAVALTDTPWVRMICHDDLLRPDCMAQTMAAVKAFDGTRVALIGNDERHLFANGYCTPMVDDKPLQRFGGSGVLKRRFSGAGETAVLPSITTATFRKSVFDQMGGFDDRWVHFDIFLWYRTLTEWDYGWIPAQLSTNRIHGRQVAVDARSELRSVLDFQAFIPPFIDEFGDKLELTRVERARGKLLPLGVAAATIAAELQAGRLKRVMRGLRVLPVHWLPMLVPLVARAVLKERRRLKTLRAHVPAKLIYP